MTIACRRKRKRHIVGNIKWIIIEMLCKKSARLEQSFDLIISRCEMKVRIVKSRKRCDDMNQFSLLSMIHSIAMKECSPLLVSDTRAEVWLGWLIVVTRPKAIEKGVERENLLVPRVPLLTEMSDDDDEQGRLFANEEKPRGKRN